MDYLLLTGCTGLIGRYLLRDLLTADVPVVALVRPDTRENGPARLESIVQNWEARLRRSLPRPICLRGDLHQGGLGLAPSDRKWLARGRGAVLHNAGNVTFHNSNGDGEPWRTNVDGTRHLIELAQETGIDEFHYVSTSYVCGDRQDAIREDQLDAGQGFESDYENSKFNAEKLVHQAGFRKLNVFRPASVTGDSLSGYTLTYHGIYLFAQFTHLARQRSGAAPGERWHHPLRVFQTGEEKHHLVPVDSVSSAIVEILRQRELPGQTYHLTPLRPCSSAELEAAIARYFGYYGLTFAGPRLPDCGALNEIERLFYDAMVRAEHRYFRGDPTFDCTNTLRACPQWSKVRIDEEYLLRTFDFAVRHRFGRVRPKVQRDYEPLARS
jgi:nucleoside-diphosphate-sugar epimerase